ncbi:MAG TPA: hypothetical protein VLF61_02430 [Rhabdochlamydiaceae bacterium]|nr:hypothetical protein [Rhabdochlamydiaceae bacterium]
MQAVQSILVYYLKDYSQDWKFTLITVGAAVSITCCALAVFANASFFALCFAFLTGICLFAAFQIHELGTFKAIAADLSATKEKLELQILALKNQAQALEAQLGTLQETNEKTLALLAVYRTALNENIALLEQLKRDCSQENQNFKEHNNSLGKLITEQLAKNLTLLDNLKHYVDHLEKQVQVKLEQLIKELAEIKDQAILERKAAVEQLKINESKLLGSIETLEALIAKLEKKLEQLQQENEKYTHLNKDLAVTTAKLQEIVVQESGNRFSGNPDPAKIPPHGTNQYQRV